MTKENLRSGGPFLLLLVLFIIAKWPHLSYPFYWDESWSYAPAVRLMYDYGPSLMPDAIDVFYSRGHPLFFYASAAAWMHLTGGYSHFNAHLFALFITVCLLVTIYAFALKFAGKAAALVAVAALMLHVGFFVQATAVVPEMMVALFSLLALSAFAARKYGLAGTALTLLLFTKESGVVAAFSIGLAILVLLFRQEVTLREKIHAVLSVTVPGILIGAFFMRQKQLLGWYFYPEHTGLISFDWGTFWGKFKGALTYLLATDGPQWLMKAVFISLVVVAIRQRTLKRLLPLLPLLIAYLITKDALHFLYSRLQFGIFTFTIAGALLVYLFTAPATGKKNWIALLTIFCYLYLCFCSLNFFTVRYSLAALVPTIIGLALMLMSALEQLSKRAIWVVPVVLAAGGFFMFRNDTGIGDVNLQSYNAMRVQEQTVRFLEKQQWFEKQIYVSNFQGAEHLRKPYTGFLNSSQFFSHVYWELDEHTEVAVFNNIESTKRLEEVKTDGRYHLVYQVQEGDVWAEIWGR